MPARVRMPIDRLGGPFTRGAVVGLALAILAMGLVLLFSATQASATHALRAERQLLWALLAIVSGLLAYRVDLDWLRHRAPLFAWAALGLLVGVLLLGKEVNGARRWFDLGPARVQAADFARLALVIALAGILASPTRREHPFLRGFLLPSALAGACFALTLLQPDFGTAFLLAAVSGTMLFLGGVPLRWLAPAALSGIAAFASLVASDPLRTRRILAFLDPEAHRDGAAYQLGQALLAFGAGGATGTGLGNGRQQIAYLPEAHTDFVFAIAGEELGIGGSALIVSLFAALTYLGVRSLGAASDRFTFLLATGCLTLLTFQALFNLGVVTGCLPTKGVSLPLVSYGGSNLLATGLQLGLFARCLQLWEHCRLPETRLREL